MNKIITIAMLGIALTTPALAAEKSSNVGVNASIDNTIGIHGEFNIQPSLSIQVFLKNNSRSYYHNNNPIGLYNYNYTALGVIGIYDFSRIISLANKKVHPFAGLGIFAVSAGNNNVSSPSTGGLYITVGARYEFSPEIDFEANVNNLGGPTIGANLKF